MLSVGFMSWLIIPQKCQFSSGTMASFPCRDERGADTPLLSQMEAPVTLALAGPTFANLSGHLIINRKKSITDSLNTPSVQELLSLLPFLSPLHSIWALSSFPSFHFSPCFADLSHYLSFTSP